MFYAPICIFKYNYWKTIHHTFVLGKNKWIWSQDTYLKLIVIRIYNKSSFTCIVLWSSLLVFKLILIITLVIFYEKYLQCLEDQTPWI